MRQSFVSRAQEVCLLSYLGGAFAHLLDLDDEDAFRWGYQNAGDLLLNHLMVELGRSEDCGSLRDACSRVARAQSDLGTVAMDLASAAQKASAAHVRLTLQTSDGRTGQCILGSKDPMNWSTEDGDGETTSATFDSFVAGQKGLEFLEQHRISGDDWRTIEDHGDLSQIVVDVRDGVDLMTAVMAQAKETAAG